jgi:hypothetical protein
VSLCLRGKNFTPIRKERKVDTISNSFFYLYIVKRLVAALFLFTYISSTTEFHEVLRLPLLFEHYAEHKIKVNDLTFWEFLTMHYKTDVAHDDHDNQLPFKVPGHEFTASIVALPTPKVSLIEPTLSVKVTHTSSYREAHFESQLQDIFQPPRI